MFSMTSHGRCQRSAFERSAFTGAIVLLLLAAGAMPAQAQQYSGRYQAELLQLAELLGGVHHLRRTCYPAEEQTWRDAMIGLVSRQNPPSWLREQMISRFNAGFHREQSSYPACDDRSQRRSSQLAADGSRLARKMARAIDW